MASSKPYRDPESRPGVWGGATHSPGAHEQVARAQGSHDPGFHAEGACGHDLDALCVSRGVEGPDRAFCEVERAVPLGEAGRRAAAALAALGLRAELMDAGAGRDPTAWWCGLLGGAGDASPVTCGMGKGRPGEARVGALFEAVEHYLTGPAGFDPAVVEPAAPARIAAGPLREDACSPLLARMPGRRMACLRYRALGGGGKALVPLFLSAPWYVETGAARLRELAGDDCDYAHLMRYSCNSGSAVGVTAAEALLHALNETIERDALSLLLVRAFLGGEGFRPRLIAPETLPHGPARAYRTGGRGDRLGGAPAGHHH